MLIVVALPFLRQTPRRAVGLGVAAAPGTLLLASYLTADSLGAGGMRWEPVTKTIARFVGMAFFRGFAAPSVAFWLALAVFGAIVLMLCLDTVRAYWTRDGNGDPGRDPMSAAMRLTVALVVCLAVLYVISPDGVGDGYNLKGRFQLVMWAWLLPALAYRGRLPSPPVIVAATAALLAWQIATFGVRTHRFNTAYDMARGRAPPLAPGATLERTLDYDHASFDGSFIKVLAHAPEDFAHRCGCVLLDGYHPSTAFYWVRTRSSGNEQLAYHVRIQQMPGADLTVVVDRQRSNRDGDPSAPNRTTGGVVAAK
jgi:hypothetical protein